VLGGNIGVVFEMMGWWGYIVGIVVRVGEGEFVEWEEEGDRLRGRERYVVMLGLWLIERRGGLKS